MIRLSVRRAFICCAAMVIAAGVCWPVVAQGQTPTTPRDRPSPGEPAPQTPTTQNPNDPNNPQPPAARDTGGSRLNRGRSETGAETPATEETPRERGRSRGEEADAAKEGGTAEKPAADEKPRSRAGQGQTSQTPAAGSGGPVTGGQGGGGGGGGTSFSRGTGAALTVTGEGAFEPALLRPVEYVDVPDEGDLFEYLEGPMPLSEFLQAINLATNWNVLATAAAREVQLEFIIAEKSPKQALEVLKFHDLVWDWDEESRFLSVFTKDEWLLEKYGTATMVEFVVEHADVTYVESLITALASSTGRVITDARNNRIYVWDTEDNLELMRQTFADVDVPLQKREYFVQHADLADIESVVSGLLTPNGSVLSDARTGQVIVWDTPAVLGQVADALTQLDVPVESKTFQITHVDAETLIESLEVLMSDRGLIQVDPRFNALIITDLPTRIGKMEEVIKTLDKPLDRRTWVIKYADLDFIADQIETFIPAEMGEVVLNDDVHQITVAGLPERLDKIEEMIAVWDIKRQQVLIEAFIVEVSTDIMREFNINWSYFDNIGNAPISFSQGAGSEGFTERGDNPITFGQLPYQVPLYGGLQLNDAGEIERPVLTNLEGDNVIDRIAGTNVAVTLDYLNQNDKATILSSPRVVVQDGEEALFENATQVPFVSGSTNFNNSSVNNFSSSNRVEFIDVGTILSVLPRVTADDNILMDVSAEDSTFIEKIIVSNGLESTVPEKTVRHAETQLRVSTGDTVVLGGLRRNSALDAVSKVPVLGDVPLLGRLFRTPKKQTEQRDLMIFLTVTIVGDTTHPETETLAQAEERIHTQMRSEDKSFWGRAHDHIAGGANEILVAIGQGGDIRVDGEPKSLEEVKAHFTIIGPETKKKIVLRSHPRAPVEVVNDVTEAALESGIKLEFDASMSPLVPAITEAGDI
jgi:general secretion pathway protein D